MEAFDVTMRPVNITDSDTQVTRGTNIEFDIAVWQPDGEPYPLDGKDVQLAIRREDKPSLQLVDETQLSLSAVGNVLTVGIDAAQSELLQAPLDPTKSFPHLIQVRVDDDGFATDLIRFHVGRRL